MSDLIRFVFSIGGLVAALAAGVIWLYARPASRQPRRFLLILAVGYAFACTFVVSYGIGRLLLMGIRPFEASDVPPGRTAVVVLGSGSFTARDWLQNELSIVDPPAAARVLETFRVYRLINPAWVVSSGGLIDPDDPDAPSGVTMRNALTDLGVPPDRIVVETESKNTHDEAVIVAALLKKLAVDHVVLVTSDIHMRRSLGTFKAEDVDAIPAVARHPYIDDPWTTWVVPNDTGLGEASSLAHEIVGVGYYFVRGWYRF